jgi:hypothetical protein
MVLFSGGKEKQSHQNQVAENGVAEIPASQGAEHPHAEEIKHSSTVVAVRPMGASGRPLRQGRLPDTARTAVADGAFGTKSAW